MDQLLEEDFEILAKLKGELKKEGNEINRMLDKKHLSRFELDSCLNKW